MNLSKSVNWTPPPSPLLFYCLFSIIFMEFLFYYYDFSTVPTSSVDSHESFLTFALTFRCFPFLLSGDTSVLKSLIFVLIFFFFCAQNVLW